MKPSDLRTILDHADPRWSLRPMLLALLELWDAALDNDGVCCSSNCGCSLCRAIAGLKDLKP